MYEELMYRLENAARGTEGRKVARDAIDAIAALQSENVEKDREIERLRLQRPVQVDGDVMALALELAETKATLSRVETERDVHMAVVAEKNEEIEKLRMQVRVKDACISGKSSIITHMETERDAARPSAEVLEAIDELVEFARDRMSIGVWLGYVNVLNEWRGAQGEG